jgi:cytoskeleton protein RodZ
MKDEHDNPDKAGPEPEADGPRGGERLAEARREQQISVLEVAKELHIDEAKVRALERNEFDVLGAPVFAKGHLRKYAQLVGVDPDDVFTDYYQMTRSDVMPPVVAAGRSRAREELSPGPWVAVIVVIIVAAVSYWWFAVQSETQVAPPAGDAPVTPEQSAAAPPVVEQPDVVTAAAVREEPAPVASQPQPDPVQVAEGETLLVLDYSGDCWTEISDATGRRLFFDMGRAGRTVELTGRAPFAVLFGNAENVDVRVDGNQYPVAPSNPGSRTARLTIVNP